MSKFWPSGQTRVAGLIGYPARYSMSPALHGSAYKALGIDMTYIVFPVLPTYVKEAVDAIRALDLVGVSVTIPHKEAVIPYLDHLSPDAERLGAVNCIVREEERLIGHNTDGVGLVRSLRDDHQFEPRGKRAVVIGAGGAARSVIGSLADAGVSDLAIINRSPERAEYARTIANDVGRIGTVDDIEGADLVINATPIGMEGAHAGELPISVDAITSKHLVIDLIYYPSRTPLLDEAAKRGATVANGLGMLIFQAAEQIELWTGQRPPIDIMRAAIS